MSSRTWLASRPLLFLRSGLFFLGYGGLSLLFSLFIFLVAPVMPWKVRHRLAQSWCAGVLGWLRWCCGVHIEISGRENLPEGPFVLLANHQSSLETFLFYWLITPAAPILKRELLHIPFWGWSLRLLKPIAIDRSSPRAAGRSLLTQGIERIREGYCVFVFPEGTRVKPDAVRSWSRGGARLAVAAGVPMVPVAHNTGEFWPPHQFIKRPGRVRMVIGEAMPTTGQSATALTRQAEQWVRERLKAQA